MIESNLNLSPENIYMSVCMCVCGNLMNRSNPNVKKGKKISRSINQLRHELAIHD